MSKHPDDRRVDFVVSADEYLDLRRVSGASKKVTPGATKRRADMNLTNFLRRAVNHYADAKGLDFTPLDMRLNGRRPRKKVSA